jgi:hypothetical protein
MQPYCILTSKSLQFLQEVSIPSFMMQEMGRQTDAPGHGFLKKNDVLIVEKSKEIGNSWRMVCWGHVGASFIPIDEKREAVRIGKKKYHGTP